MAHDETRQSSDQTAQQRVEAKVSVSFDHRLWFTRDVMDHHNTTLADAVCSGGGQSARVMFVVDDGVAAAWPDLERHIARYVETHRDRMTQAGEVMIVPGGEQAKNEWNVYENVVAAINRCKLCRQSYVIAIGGGAMLDAVGFAATTAHRGVRLVRVPTTTLAQCDAAIGVKNGINAFGKKNFIGAFAVPWAVINDHTFLATLEDRDWRSGLSEVVKVALVKDGLLFDRIVSQRDALAHRDSAALQPLLRASAELHMQHIVSGGDPFELTEARPLDFGHWAAHKLEQMTNFQLAHGEAVAIGIAIDVMYAQLSGWLSETDASAIISCLTQLGFELNHDSLRSPDELLEGLEEFREHLGGRLTIAMLRGIGHSFDVYSIDTATMHRAIRRLAAAAARAA